MAARTMVFPLRAFLAAPLYQEGIDFPQSLSPKAKHRNSELSNYHFVQVAPPRGELLNYWVLPGLAGSSQSRCEKVKKTNY